MRIAFSSFFYLFLIFSIAHSYAGGPLFVSYSGDASRWDNSSTLTLHPESGTCSGLSATQMSTRLSEMADIWSALDGVDVTVDVERGTITQDIDGDNYGSFIPYENGSVQSAASSDDGVNPVIFDEDGDVMASIAGAANRTALLGMSAPSGFSDDYLEIHDGWIIVNCLCFEDATDPAKDDCNGSLYDDDMLRAILLHEMGHFLNLDHSQVNEDVIGDESADPDDLATMYPFMEFPEEQQNPQTDDRMTLAVLYPASDLDSQTCTVIGTLLDDDGKALRCADVQAVTTDPSDTVAVVSGNIAVVSDNNDDGDTIDDGECESGCGEFSLNLPVGKAYTLNVRAINPVLTGASGLGPCKSDPLTTVEDETLTTITASQCSSGALIDLGDIDTQSSGGVEESGSGDDEESATGSGSEGPSSCSLYF